MAVKDCCSFNTEVKGVMFYEGKDHLQSMSHVYSEKDALNIHRHDKAYAVKLCCNDKMLGHLSVDVAAAIHEINEYAHQQPHAIIKLLGTCVSGLIFSNVLESRSYRYRVTDLLISIRADIICHPIIKQLLDNHKINYEVYIQKGYK